MRVIMLCERWDSVTRSWVQQTQPREIEVTTSGRWIMTACGLSFDSKGKQTKNSRGTFRYSLLLPVQVKPT